MTDESLPPFHRNRVRLPRKQDQHVSSSKANRQLVKRNRPSFSGGTDLRISSPNTFTRNGSKLNNWELFSPHKNSFHLLCCYSETAARRMGGLHRYQNRSCLMTRNLPISAALCAGCSGISGATVKKAFVTNSCRGLQTARMLSSPDIWQWPLVACLTD
ncbi:unnamed protein product [Protopolystoma xenopodis]|uniref:Uncharacterized protein n=1 Tax=Protopolystoma xenopodis TaxID=117903 RepID=A0A448X6W8_9PLAT|nr:unnamed protein product [Protopolystoma xenopodis]